MYKKKWEGNDKQNKLGIYLFRTSPFFLGRLTILIININEYLIRDLIDHHANIVNKPLRII
jgi:hypothetical protein